MLRATAFVQAGKIVHIPWVLYHWRAVSGSTALDAESKSYTTQGGDQKNCKITLLHIDVTITAGLVENTYRVHWPLPAKQPLVSLRLFRPRWIFNSQTMYRLDFIQNRLSI